MAKIMEKILDQRYNVVLLIIGSIFVIFSFYDLRRDSGQIEIDPAGSPNSVLVVLGICFIIGSFVIAAFHEGLLDRKHWSKKNFQEELPGQNLRQKIRETSTGFETKFHQTTVCVHFGLLQDKFDLDNPKAAVVLPCNDLFDDECFEDKGIALGGYLASHPNELDIESIKEGRDKILKNSPSKEINDGFPRFNKSYDIGTCIYLVVSRHRMLVTAVSTKRKVEGVRSEITYLHRVMRSVLHSLANNELNTIYVPLIGSGKGGVPHQIAFLSLLNAIYECALRSGGRHFSNVHIVVFKSNENADPELSSAEVRQILQIVLRGWN